MGATKHEKSFVDFEQPYEQNLIGLKGILYFGIGLFLLIVITFGLMWVFLAKMDEEFKTEKASTNPMAMTEKERLPAEPRLQLAPGFGMESKNGWVNMELKAPQAEYWEYKKQAEDIWEHGQKDPRTGTVIALPIEEAKARLIEQKVKAKSGEAAEKAYKGSKMLVSDSTSGRRATETRR